MQASMISFMQYNVQYNVLYTYVKVARVNKMTDWNYSYIVMWQYGDAFTSVSLAQFSDETPNLTYSCGLHQECDNAEEVHISVVNGELCKDRPCVCIQPFVLEQILKGAVDEVNKNICTVGLLLK